MKGTRKAEGGAQNSESMTFRLGDVAEMNPRGDMSHLSDDTVVGFVPMSAVSETTKTITSPETRRFGDVRKGYTPMRNGDVIVAKITPCFENGKLAIVDLEQSFAFGSTEFHVFRPTGEVDSRLLHHLLSSELIQKEGRNQMKGAAGQKRVPSDFFRAFEFRVPRSLPEQKRIAAILDKADAIRRKLQQSLRLSDDFLRSVFLDMFGDPVTNPKGFPKAALGDIIKLKSGNSLVAKDMTEGGLHPVYGGNGINGYHDSFMFEKRMIVLGRVGAYCGVVHYTLPKSWITDNALYVETMKKKMEPIYLVDALRFANLNQYAGQAGQPLISGGRVYPVEILDVSPDLQASYAAIVNKTQAKIQKSTAFLKEAESLFSTLQQRAFRGEL